MTEKNLRLLFLLNSCLEFNEYKGSDLLIPQPTLVKSEKMLDYYRVFLSLFMFKRGRDIIRIDKTQYLALQIRVLSSQNKGSPSGSD